jgi:hypothetical protein
MGGHASKGCQQADGSIRTEPMMDVGNVAKTLVFLAGLEAGADVIGMDIMWVFSSDGGLGADVQCVGHALYRSWVGMRGRGEDSA